MTNKSILHLLVFGVLILSASFGKCQNTYPDCISEAWKLYESKEYEKSASKYTEAFDQVDGKAFPSDRYNAACSHALAGDMETSFYHLFKLAENPKTKYKNYDHISKDTDLESLHKDDRWVKLMEVVKTNQVEAEKYLDKDLVATLETVRTDYRNNRHLVPQILAFEEKNGKGTEEMKVHWTRINEKDSLNLVTVKSILDERGWLGAKTVGEQGNHTLFLIIQHADLETQMTYLPMMRDAVKLGNANPISLAQLEDGVALQQGKRQIYGSKIEKDPETGERFVLPLIDPENVDARRSEIGLEPLAEYVSLLGMTWDIDQHIKRTKALEAEK